MPVPHFDLSASGMADVERMAYRPDNVIFQTVDTNKGALANLAMLSSGRLSLVKMPCFDGMRVVSISVLSSSTALATGTNQWFSIHDQFTLARLVQTVDDTTAAWGASTFKTLALTAPYTFAYTGWCYVGIMVAATTVPTISGLSISATLAGLTPVLGGTSTTGLTTTAPNPAAAITASGNYPFVQLRRT